MWEKIKDNALSTIVTVLITGVVSIMGSSLANKNKTLEEFGELKNQITKNFDSLNARLDTELKLIDLKNKMQDEKIAELERKVALSATQEQMLNLSQQQKETTDRIEKKLDVVYEKLIYKKFRYV